MTDDGQQTRLALGAMLIPIFFVVMFALCIIGTYHKPHPNGIKVAVVGPAQTAPLRAGLAKAGGSAFDISQVATPARRCTPSASVTSTRRSCPPRTEAARDRDRRRRRRPPRREGERGLRPPSPRPRAQTVVRDVRPLPPGDAIGVGDLHVHDRLHDLRLSRRHPALHGGPRPAAGRRYSIIAGVAVLIPLLAYLIGGLGFGTYTGSFGTILAFIGVAALYVFVIGLITRLLQVLIGPAALFVVARDLRVPEHPEPRRHLHARVASLVSGASSTTSGSERRRPTPRAASSTSVARASAPTCSSCWSGRA